MGISLEQKEGRGRFKDLSKERESMRALQKEMPGVVGVLAAALLADWALDQPLPSPSGGGWRASRATG